MSGNKFLLDTNTILFILNGDETLVNFLFEKELYVSVISEMELLSYKNLTDKERQTIISFLGDCTVVNISERIKLTTIEVKKASSIKLPDSIIAATAIAMRIPFITSDQYFKKIKGLHLIYYEK